MLQLDTDWYCGRLAATARLLVADSEVLFVDEVRPIDVYVAEELKRGGDQRATRIQLPSSHLMQKHDKTTSDQDRCDAVVGHS